MSSKKEKLVYLLFTLFVLLNMNLTSAGHCPIEHWLLTPVREPSLLSIKSWSRPLLGLMQISRCLNCGCVPGSLNPCLKKILISIMDESPELKVEHYFLKWSQTQVTDKKTLDVFQRLTTTHFHISYFPLPLWFQGEKPNELVLLNMPQWSTILIEYCWKRICLQWTISVLKRSITLLLLLRFP